MSLRLARPAAVIAVAFASLLAAPAFAQADTATARQAYAEVNGKLASLSLQRLTVRRPGVGYDSELRAWREGATLRKIESVARDDDGDVVIEYYFGKAQEFVFAYVAIQGRDGARPVTRVEHRQYFADGRLFKWLGGKEAAPIPASDPEFAAEGRARLEELAFYVPALAKAKAAPAAPPPGDPPATVVVAGRRLPAIGTLREAVNGDIACYLTLRDDAGAEFTASADFELCADAKLKGRRLALTYRVESVQAASCQGDPDCRKTEKVPLVVSARPLGPAVPKPSPK